VFSQAFLKDLAEVWSEEGREAMVKTAKANPAIFFATCARLIGPEVKLTIEQSLPSNLSMEDWQVMREVIATVRQAIPDAGSERIEAMHTVFEMVPTTLAGMRVQIDFAGSGEFVTDFLQIAGERLTDFLEALYQCAVRLAASSHGRYIVFRMAEAAIPRQMFQEILRLIAELRPQSPLALA
jgi:hypothetical protein